MNRRPNACPHGRARAECWDCATDLQRLLHQSEMDTYYGPWGKWGYTPAPTSPEGTAHAHAA
jgi:hypothetical protein